MSRLRPESAVIKQTLHQAGVLSEPAGLFWNLPPLCEVWAVFAALIAPLAR